ncbi:MAG: TIGR03618 family F420-dependent PPOX class oxidoreductase [Dehalococcoidia bacterium]
MTPTEREAFVTAPRIAILSTLTPAGRVHSVPIWYRYADGAFRMITDPASVKVRNLHANPRASLCVDERNPDAMAYVTVEGPVTFEKVTREERVAMWTRYRDAEVAAQVTASNAHESMLLLVLRPERWMD